MVAYTTTAVTASTNLSQHRHGDGGVVVNNAAGVTLTLPPAAGRGTSIEVFIGTSVTSNNVIIKTSGTDVMSGVLLLAPTAGGAVNGYGTAANTNTISLNGTTKGGLKGDKLVLRDVASGLWRVDGSLTQSGTVATPFSNT